MAYRGLSAGDIAALETSDTTDDRGIEVVQGSSAEVQHLVFNMKDPVVGKLGVRQAIAHLVDREALVEDVYKSTATPLYSIVPAGINGHNTALLRRLRRPRRGQGEEGPARGRHHRQGEAHPLVHPQPLRPGHRPGAQGHRRPAQRQRLFEADVKSVAFEQYEKDIAAGKYGVYVKGWVPDYPDADNFTAPFFGKGNVLGNHYENAEITGSLLPKTAATADRAGTADEYAKVQDVVAEELPLLPLWQGKQYAVSRTGVTGLEWTLDASTVFRFWELRKS